MTNKTTHESKMIIGADGATSVVRRSLAISNPLLYTGLFVRTKNPLETKKITVYLNKYLSPDFFSWIIPQNNEYGLITAIRPHDYFEYFKKEMNLPEGLQFSFPIPIGCTKSYSDKAILVGDSCGQTKPLTGGGIIFSLTAAKHAINIINEACEKKRFDKAFLSEYETLWKNEFKSEIRKQLLIRKIYRKLSNNDIEKAFKDFGPSIENLKEFNYDHFSSSWRSMPKWKLFKFFLTKIPSLLSKAP